MSARFNVPARLPATAAIALAALGGACSASPEPRANSHSQVHANQSRADLFLEITGKLRAAIDGAHPDPNPFRGDPAAADSYARAYRSAFTYGALGVGGWSHVGGDAAFSCGWADGLRAGFGAWSVMADDYGYKW
jgi:hypothetical protein